MPNYDFLSKSLFFPKQGILVIGDLHIGYDEMLRQSGVLIPERQIKEIIKDLEKIFKIIKEKKRTLNKIVFIGDIKHAFGFEHEERNEFEEVLEFLGEKLPAENIIFIKGNHDTIDYSPNNSMKDFHIEGEIAFIHGDEYIKEVFNKNTKTIIMGHLHPSIILVEKNGVKKEKFKCFLTGKYKEKEVIILPSFLDFPEGTPVNDYNEDYIESFSIIPRKDILKFNIQVIGENKIYDFGIVRDL